MWRSIPKTSVNWFLMKNFVKSCARDWLKIWNWQIEQYIIEKKRWISVSSEKISWNQFVIVANKNFGNCISNSFHEMFTNESDRVTVWKNQKTLTKKIRQINYLAIYSGKPLLSRNFHSFRKKIAATQFFSVKVI